MLTQDDVLYMIVTDRFQDGDVDNNGAVDLASIEARHGGDLLGVVQRMPYLKRLGITAIWITPVYPNPPAGYHGYHPLDFEHVDPHLCSPELGESGDRDVIRRFVEIAHEHGLKVMLDIIVSHTAPDHPWVRQRPEWYRQNLPTEEKWWLWGLPCLDHDNIDVNLYFSQNVLTWIEETGADAIRIDAARHVEKAFWSIFKLFAKGRVPAATLVGEVWDTDPGKVAPYQAYHGFDSMFDFPLYHAIVDVFAEEKGFGRIARPELSPWEPSGVLNRDDAYRDAYQLVTFLENHDTARFFHLCGGPADAEKAMARLRLALLFLFTTRGIPQLYYGGELAIDGGPHPDNRRDMPWHLVDGASAQTPEAERAASTRQWTEQLILLRRRSAALRYGWLTTLYVTTTLYAFARFFTDDVVFVVLNNGWAPADVLIPISANPRLPEVLRNHLGEGAGLVNVMGGRDCVDVRDGNIRVKLGPKSGAVYRPVGGRLNLVPPGDEIRAPLLK